MESKARLAEFEGVVFAPEDADRRFEFIAGEIVEAISTNYASMIGVRVAAPLVIHVEKHELGFVTGAKGAYIVGNDRYMPTVAFISRERQPEPSREAYNPNAPDLAVEVLSPSDDPAQLRIKIVNYLRAGTTLWVVDPDTQRVEVYAPNADPMTLGVGETLDGGDILPGFSMSVKSIFGA